MRQQSDAEPVWLPNGCTLMYFFVFPSLIVPQGHFEAFAKTLITLLKTQTMSRMLQSIYYVGNKCAHTTVRYNNHNGSLRD